MRYRFIDQMKEQFAINRLCKIMEVTRSSYYRWKKAPRDVSGDDKRILDAIGRLREDRRKHSYGSRRLMKALQAEGFIIGRKRVRRLMRQAGILVRCRRAFRPKTTDSNHNDPVAPNLVNRQFTVRASNTVWAGDITYLRCGTGWVYLAVVMDLYSRRVIGWSIQPTLQRRLVLNALRMATGMRSKTKDVIFHSDRGSQYTSEKYRCLLANYQMQASMSRKGDCWDNAPVESFFSTLKKEAYLSSTMSASEIRQEIFDYIEVFYNRQRIHSKLGGISPEKFELGNLESSKLCA